MTSITYGGVKYNLYRHAIYCKKCADTIESEHNHDFKSCKCGAVSIDGGVNAGNRILGKFADIETRDIYCSFVDNKKIILPQHIIEERFTERIMKTDTCKGRVS
jgi:hypothetical protein